MQQVEVAVVGGSAAGLSAALTLARACRTVAVFDGGAPRNAAARAVHGFLSRDGHAPGVLLGAARAQLSAYPRVSIRDVGVSQIVGDDDSGFLVESPGGAAVRAARVILATGMIDQLPAVPGFAERWGRDVFHCPYCHGWEVAGRRWGIVAYDRPRVARRLDWLRNWTEDLVLFVADAVDDDADPPGVQVERRVISGLIINGSGLAGVTVTGGDEVPLRALLWPVHQRLPALIVDLGLTLDLDGHVLVDGAQQTSQPGIFAAGDVSWFARQQVVDAAASGVAAAKAVVNDLTRRRIREPSAV